MYKDTKLPNIKDWKIIANCTFFFSISISIIWWVFNFPYTEIETDRLETLFLILMSITPKEYEVNGIEISMEQIEIKPLWGGPLGPL